MWCGSVARLFPTLVYHLLLLLPTFLPSLPALQYAHLQSRQERVGLITFVSSPCGTGSYWPPITFYTFCLLFPPLRWLLLPWLLHVSLYCLRYGSWFPAPSNPGLLLPTHMKQYITPKFVTWPTMPSSLGQGNQPSPPPSLVCSGTQPI